MTALVNRVVITFCVLFPYILGYGQVNVFFSDTSRQDQIWYDSLTPRKKSDTLSLKDKVISNDIKNFSNNIYRLILKPDHSYSAINSDSLILSVYQPYQGLVIRNIVFNQLNTFGQELNDTTKKVLNFAQKAGNKTHFKTSERVLRNRLLIKEGDKIDPVILADNERLLRELSFIQDARIYIEHDTMSKDSIDLIVVIKDKWSMAFSAEIFDVDYGKIGIWNQNLFGLGNEVYFQTNYKFNRTPIIEFKTEYKINNIYNTLIEAKLGYEKKEDKEVSRI
ncbi:MAG: hypothetical protein MI922_20775, partial [Bacteroidales bacterium]|nr:hypothetical protein [Bacteroidales bacterium]